jgi:DNA helicase II / ATP-dependent DNA helicase PcrA
VQRYRGRRFLDEFLPVLVNSTTDDFEGDINALRPVTDFLRSARSLERASANPRFYPLLAATVIAIERCRLEPFDHIIVDEAQDIRPLEWKSILHLSGRQLRDPGAPESREPITLVGDMNQRRSAHTAASWADLATDLELFDERGKVRTVELQVGVRSTESILRYASKLLAGDQGAVRALRHGPEPEIVQCRSADEVKSTAIRKAGHTACRISGTVAIITAEADAIHERAGRWRTALSFDGLKDVHADVIALRADEARGLEFDVAVVVEPADFPIDEGRRGLLYTSLTRATRELMVVHARPLPRELR